MAALLVTTVVASSSQTGFAALLPSEREGRPSAVDLSTTSRSSFGIESVSGSTTSQSGLSSGRAVRSLSVDPESNRGATFGLRAISKDSGGYSALSSRLPNDVNQAASSMAMVSRRPEEYYSTMVTDVIENVEFERVTLNETKHAKESKQSKYTEREVHTPVVAHTRHDVSRLPRLDSSHMDMEGSSKPVSVKDYMEQAPGFVWPSDTGPPRWFCPVETAGSPPDAPILLFLPGMDSTGLGILLHQRQLSRIFEVQCLHIPISDRTPFDGLVEIVEKRIRAEYDRKQAPIYLMAESFGGCLALSVAARNPDLDIVLVIANPATCFESSPLQPFIPLMQWVPDQLFQVTPYLLSFTMGDPVRMASTIVDSDLPPWERLPKVVEAMRDLLPTLPVLAEIMPRELLTWKVRLLSDGAKYANARLRYIKADILLLASGKDQMIPSADEARRLKDLLPQMKVRYFPDSGHTLLLEDGLDVASLIKQTHMLRHKKHKKYDPVNDYRFPTSEEITIARRNAKFVHQLFSPIFLTAENGKIRKGLPQLPKGRPLLFVSNHTLIGFDLGLVVEEVLEKRGVLLRGLAHPLLNSEPEGVEESAATEVFKLFGTVPVSGSSLYKVLARGEAALLYPGGVREALKRKGEAYRLFWSESAEFVRTAIRHGATIVPFSSVGGDDIIEILLDSNDLLNIPVANEYLRQYANQFPNARTTGTGEVTQEVFITPVGYPKPPPRFYFMFKQPISTEGMLDSINDRAVTDKLYRKVLKDVETGLEYIIQKREEDPYKDFLPRVVYEAANKRQAPTFNF
ncbi:unnamed protein product [Calypogeia fissa]